MTSSTTESIALLLQQLHGHGYFKPQAGPLTARLADLAQEQPGAAGEGIALSGPDLDLEVSVGCQEGGEAVVLEVRLDLPGQTRRFEVAVAALDQASLEDLAGYLKRLVQDAAPAPVPEAAAKAGQRTVVEGDHHDQSAAAARLKVSPQWLKSVVPCTDYSYEEIDGKKIIHDYYWSKDLIERLFKIKSTKTTPEDLQYVATECCEGDQDWARDLIARLKSPNRVEPPARDQAQKGQGGAPQRDQTQRHQGGQGGKDQPQKNQAGAGAGEQRSRSRSRHKRFRDQGKDGGRKPDSNPGPKKPTG